MLQVWCESNSRGIPKDKSAWLEQPDFPRVSLSFSWHSSKASLMIFIYQVVIYSADGLSGEQLRRSAREKFCIDVPDSIEVPSCNGFEVRFDGNEAVL